MVSLTTSSRAALVREIKRLRAELASKKKLCTALTKEARKRMHHAGTKTGAEAETYVQDLFKRGLPTQSHADHDLLVGRCRIEIKASGCHVHSTDSAHRKWVWHKFRGSGGKKRYHLLVLVGAVDPRYYNEYKSAESNFVLFAIPHQGVRSFAAAAAGGTLSLGTNPGRVQSEIRRRLWKRYHVSASGLKRKVREINARLKQDV